MHTYEIGSLTKTFTAAMISKAIQEGKIDINDTIDKYLPLAEGKNYPDIEELLTHTSGYKAYYFENPMCSNFLNRRNDFYGITKEMVLNKASAINLPDKEYPFHYSNYGYAVLGLLLEKVYQKDYRVLMNQFIEEDLQLKNTRISDKSGDISNYWDWKEKDAYLSAGAITSDISDMLAYAKMQLEEDKYFKQCHERIKEINASTEEYKMMDINMDAIGMAWIIDKENNIIWHNGGTDNYNSYIGFNLKKGTAVVILSNLSPGYRIPATVLGVKLLKSLD
ncbi:serine hydrolase domain-containing protein [Anaerocolumna jejuensis]|uniref:serine hydrolase domain-containing protein n=1 Tax=Anaerocolumna jejuensis TaxID=259063 RepID=UPI003F7B7D4E